MGRDVIQNEGNSPIFFPGDEIFLQKVDEHLFVDVREDISFISTCEPDGNLSSNSVSSFYH